MAVPRFLPTWLGGEADRVDGGGVPLRPVQTDALPERPETVDDPLPEAFERLLRNPEIAVPEDRLWLDLLRDQARRDPDTRITREAFLTLFRLLDFAEGDSDG